MLKKKIGNFIFKRRKSRLAVLKKIYLKLNKNIKEKNYVVALRNRSMLLLKNLEKKKFRRVFVRRSRVLVSI
jgi:hypothetical protein